ncbi:MAG: endolytic transglycosylase MltG [Eubacteriaceae bacterium]|uniref:Endolytic murein transglycosylase n=1 Tax=Candidatus Pseudoramibacter fermentans TaxID=2594427 RepID=A0A6L5GSA4_9FIRM|nr:endolytic transglycosylase MltG [Candidatus Pseudoramibacter fermentans]RRF93895.1 MAG: endolytic transglycosylase MltG [Eubacteriaceae bacterium]
MAQKDQSSLFDEHTTNENETKNLFADSEKIKEQVKRSRRKVFITIIVIALCAVGLCAGWRIYYNSQLEPVSSSKKKIIVEIPEGSNIDDIAKILYDSGLIKNRMVFQSYAGRHSRGIKQIKAANYRFTPSMSSVDIFNAMLNGKDYDGAVAITIPEGKNIKEIGAILESRHICSSADFINETKKVSEYKKNYSILSSYPDNAEGRTPMEGYLFADTYQFTSNSSAATVVSKMLANTQSKFSDAMLKKISDNHQTVDQILTMASLIEMESKLDSDKPKIASAFYNRLAKNMKLQSDATVNYALGEKKTNITNSDLKVDSPYNTYANTGMPIGPICSPSLKSIKAAISPAKTDYLYFVSDSSGKTYYANNLQDHQANVDKYLNN